MWMRIKGGENMRQDVKEKRRLSKEDKEKIGREKASQMLKQAEYSITIVTIVIITHIRITNKYTF